MIENFVTDKLKTVIQTHPEAKSVVVRFGDKNGRYKISGSVLYSYDKEKWYVLREYKDYPRTAPYICLTIDPSYKYLAFDLTVTGGKFLDVYTSENECSKIKKEITEETGKKKGFLEQLTDLVRATIFLIVLLLAIGIIGVVAFMLMR